jgi:hypothetical protein
LRSEVTAWSQLGDWRGISSPRFMTTAASLWRASRPELPELSELSEDCRRG